MVHRRAIIVLMIAPVMLVAGGCMNLRLPAIDPSGRGVFLPNPNYTTLAQDAPFSRLFHGRDVNQMPAGSVLPGPYEPALFNKHRERLSRYFQIKHGPGGTGPGIGSGIGSGIRDHFQRHGERTGNPPVFANTAEPPPCGPDGLTPDGTPCYPIGSPTQSSLAATLPGSANRPGSALGSVMANPNRTTPGCNTPSTPTARGLATPDPAYAASAQQQSLLSTQQVSLSGLARLGPGVVLARQRITARVGEEVVVLGGIQSSAGVTRPGEPVQWSMSNDSVGTFIDTARVAPAPQQRRLLGFLHRKPAAPVGGSCGNCLNSVTSARCDVLPRNPLDPNDDISLSRGQTWVSLTSGSEGASFVTLSAPQLQGRRQATARIDWIDANWDCPRPVITSMEGPGRLVLTVYKNTNKRPLEAWPVRFKILDGPRARLGNSDDNQSLDTRTDSAGRAFVDVYPIGTEANVTRVQVEIFDPNRPNDPIGRCIGYVTWSESAAIGPPPNLPPAAPALPPPAQPPPDVGGGFGDGLGDGPVYGDAPGTGGAPGFSDRPDFDPPRGDTSFPSTRPPVRGGTSPPPATQTPQRAQLAIDPQGPLTADVGSPVRYTVTVTNTSDVLAEQVFVTTPMDDRVMRMIEGGTPGVRPYENRYWAWDLGPIPGRTSKQIVILYQPVALGVFNPVFEAVGTNAITVDNDFKTQVVGKLLEVAVSSAPDPPVVGEIAEFAIQVNNLSNELMDTMLIVKNWGSGIEPVDGDGRPQPGARQIQLRVAFPRGPSDPIPVQFRALEPGTHEFDVIVEDTKSNQSATATGTLLVREPEGEPELSLRINGPPRLRAGDHEVYRFYFKNTGSVSLVDVTVDVFGNEDIQFLKATQDHTPSEDGSVLRWRLAEVRPEFGYTFEVDCRISPRPIRGQARLGVQVSTEEGYGEQFFDIEIEEGIGSSGTTAQKPPADEAKTLRAEMASRPTSVRVGEPVDVVVAVTNDNPKGFRDLQVSMEAAEGIRFQSVSGPPATTSTVGGNGRMLDFSSVREILPGEQLKFRARVIPGRKGIARLLGRVRATGLTNPLIISTEVPVN